MPITLPKKRFNFSLARVKLVEDMLIVMDFVIAVPIAIVIALPITMYIYLGFT